MPLPKPHRRYLFYRAYCVVTLVAWNVVGLKSFLAGGYGEALLPLLPAFVPALFMTFNLAVFRFPYSVFGPLLRTSAPDEPVIESSRFTDGAIGWFHATFPFFSWYVYPSGIAFSILGVGRGFVPFSQVSALKDGLLAFSVRHTSPQVRGSMFFTSRALYDSLKSHMPHLARVPEQGDAA